MGKPASDTLFGVSSPEVGFRCCFSLSCPQGQEFLQRLDDLPGLLGDFFLDALLWLFWSIQVQVLHMCWGLIARESPGIWCGLNQRKYLLWAERLERMPKGCSKN